MKRQKKIKEEVWRPVVGFERYYSVSNRGNVLSFWHSGKGRPIKPLGKPYYHVSLHDKRGAKAQHIRVHTLVCTAFHGPRPSPDHEVNHKNGKKTDNRAKNLEWTTHIHNMQHAIESGLSLGGLNFHLTDDGVIELGVNHWSRQIE